MSNDEAKVCRLTGIDRDTSMAIQALLYRYGFKWHSMERMKSAIHLDKTVLIANINDMDIVYSVDDVPNHNEHHIAHHHLGFLQMWLTKHGLVAKAEPDTTENVDWEEPPKQAEPVYAYARGVVTRALYRLAPGAANCEAFDNGKWERTQLSAEAFKDQKPCDKDGNYPQPSPTPTEPTGPWVTVTKGGSKWLIDHNADGRMTFVDYPNMTRRMAGTYRTVEHLIEWPRKHGFTIMGYSTQADMMRALNADSKEQAKLEQHVPELDPEIELHNQETQTTTDTSNMTTPAKTPYDAMIDDLTKRVTEEVRRTAVTDDRLRETVIQELAKQNKLSIVIEDRRKDPVEHSEPNEAHHHCVPDLIGEIQAENSVALVGPTGSGKTLGVLQVARILDIKLVCIKQMTRIIAPHDLIGFVDATGNYRPGAWTDAILGHHYDGTNKELLGTTKAVPAIIVVDEMDNANENIIMLLKGLKTGRLMMPYGMQEVNPRLIIVATMNTWGTGATREYVGRCAQDAALLNEFMFIEWGYDTGFEWELLQRQFNTYKDPGEYTIIHMRQLLDMFISMRAKATQQNIRVIISTRNIIDTAKSLICNPHKSIHDTLKKGVYKGLKDEDIKRVECPEIWTKKAARVATKEIAQQAIPTPNVVPAQGGTFGQTVPVTPKPVTSGQDIDTDDCPI